MGKNLDLEEESVNQLFTFVLGVLVGWLVEWLIDFFYWRKRCAEKEATARHETLIARAATVVPPESKTAEKITPDNLQVIKGIGPVIERKLNDEGIYTFEQLGNLTPAGLQSLLSDVIQRLADEESLLQQARDLARRK
jgi:predicted flap endonuclease-1-like 5' DNA nuclease